MSDNFDILIYKKLNPDLVDLSDEELMIHFNTIGQYQMRIFSNKPFKNDIVYIFTTKFGYYISSVLQYLLFKNNIPSKIIYKINLELDNLHIITFAQKVEKFPKNYIIYQLEQKDISKWINKKYELAILFSKKTFDYSQSNINKFPEIIRKKMICYPIPIIPYNYLNYKLDGNIIAKNNILFYGSINKSREIKLNYLNKKLYPKYFIKILNNVFGKDLFNEIINSRIILNIHFYKEAILETYRINEILSCGKMVISETPNEIDIDNYNQYKKYENNVIFVNNMDEMAHNIIYQLENNKDQDNISFFDIEKFNNLL